MILEAIGLAVSLLATSAPPVVGAPLPESSQMTLGANVPAPIGYLRFCRRRPDQCGLTSASTSGSASIEPTPTLDLRPNAIVGQETALSEPSAPLTRDPSVATPSGPATFAMIGQTPVMRLTDKTWAALSGINQTVNGELRPMSDEQAFGIANYWTLPLEDEHRAVGNCKHYALEKRKALVDAGLSPDTLSLAIVRTGTGELHAVLVVATDRGEFLLDNLTGRIRGWKDAHYQWLARQTPGHPLDWVSVVSPS